MKTKNWNILIYLHGALLLWFVLFIVSLLIPDGGKTASILAVGNALFLFANIPLAVLSFILNAKDYGVPQSRPRGFIRIWKKAWT